MTVFRLMDLERSCNRERMNLRKDGRAKFEALYSESMEAVIAKGASAKIFSKGCEYFCSIYFFCCKGAVIKKPQKTQLLFIM